MTGQEWGDLINSLANTAGNVASQIIGAQNASSQSTANTNVGNTTGVGTQTTSKTSINPIWLIVGGLGLVLILKH